MTLYIFQYCTYFDKKKLREIYKDTKKLEQGVLGTPNIWDKVSPGNWLGCQMYGLHKVMKLLHFWKML